MSAKREMSSRSTAIRRRSQAADGVRLRHAEMVGTKERAERKRHRFLSPSVRRLGLVEYTLIALIALGVAITVAMAILNP